MRLADHAPAPAGVSAGISGELAGLASVPGWQRGSRTAIGGVAWTITGNHVEVLRHRSAAPATCRAGPGAAAAGVFSFAEVYGGRTAVMSWAA
jgi:hypothetical protein